jgi:hypothetical protein
MFAFALLLPRSGLFKFQSSTNSSKRDPLRERKMASEQFVGTWNLVESENFDEYMKKVITRFGSNF